MDLKLIYAIILSVLPISELRGGLPIAIIYANEHNIPLILIFSLIILINILVIFIVFYFLDNIHKIFLKNNSYKKIFGSYIKRFQKRMDKFEKRYSAIGFLALTLFVAIPLPVTGVWSGCLASWILDLNRKKSIFAISLGVIVAGILVFFGTLGFLSLLS